MIMERVPRQRPHRPGPRPDSGQPTLLFDLWGRLHTVPALYLKQCTLDLLNSINTFLCGFFLEFGAGDTHRQEVGLLSKFRMYVPP